MAFLIRSLNRGGAERQLAMLAANLPRDFEPTVLTFYDGGPIWDELAQAPGVRLRSLKKRGRWEVVAFVLRLTRLLRQSRPSILHCYLVEPSILGLIAARAAGVPVVIWGVRASDVDFSQYDRAQRIAFRLSVFLSRFPTAIVANSARGREYHQRQGYAAARFDVVPNGIDTERFRPCAAARFALRDRWGIRSDDLLIGIAARLDPMKGHSTLLHAIRQISVGRPGVKLVCVGSGPPAYVRYLQDLSNALGLGSRVLWVGEMPEMSEVYPSFDIACSASSFGEGFSNSIGEAMACGVPCVVTNVGDGASIVGDTGLVVEPNVAQLLAEALEQFAALSSPARAVLGQQARDRIVAFFGKAAMIAATVTVYRGLLKTGT